ncbi:MAG: hypothetical protein ACYST6_04725 [Planctomycetota bacterium]|jgi:hypothetical protein
MKTKKVLSYVLAGILAGCVPVMSLHPLYTEQDVAFEEKLLGVWVNDPNDPEEIWEFKRPDESKAEYELIFSDKEGKRGIFAAHLVKLDGRLFLDAFPKEFPCEVDDPNKTDWHYNAFFMVPAHTFMTVDCIEPLQAVSKCLSEDEPVDEDSLKSLSTDYDSVLKLRLTNGEEFEKLLEQDPNAVKHAKMENNGLILTASTRQLQEFVLKYADDERVFSDVKVLVRRKAEASQGPAEEDASEGEATKPSAPE